jgi:phosphatidate cytidylyltransferase
MHNQRLLTAIVLGPLLFVSLWWGGEYLYRAILVGVSAICLYEYFVILYPGRRVIQGLGVLMGLAPILAAVVWGDPALVVPSIYLVLVGSIVVFLASYASWSNAFGNWAEFFMGAAYIGTCAAHFWFLRILPMGKEWVVFLLVVVWSGDAGAYYVGRGIGRHKLCPRISGGKTVEGAVGGLAANCVAASILWLLVFQDIDLLLLLPLAVLLGVIGQIGDLAESVMKRSFGVKDSGALLPGHGGIFDRVDAVLMATPAMYWILSLAKMGGVVTR